MKKYRIKFRIGDIFSPDDIISQRIIALCMAVNDLTHVAYYMIEEAKKNSNGAKRRIFYLVRLSCSHLWEAIQVIEKIETQPEFGKIYEKLTNESKIIFKNLKQEYEPLRNVMKKIRNSFFHYMRTEDIKSALKMIVDAKTEILTVEKIKDFPSDLENASVVLMDIFDHFYYNLADDIVALTHLREIKKVGITIDVLIRILIIIFYFWKILSDFIMAYLGTRPEVEYSLEKI